MLDNYTESASSPTIPKPSKFYKSNQKVNPVKSSSGTKTAALVDESVLDILKPAPEDRNEALKEKLEDQANLRFLCRLADEYNEDGHTVVHLPKQYQYKSNTQ